MSEPVFQVYPGFYVPSAAPPDYGLSSRARLSHSSQKLRLLLQPMPPFSILVTDNRFPQPDYTAIRNRRKYPHKASASIRAQVVPLLHQHA